MTVVVIDDLPDGLSAHLQSFLAQRPGWTQERVVQNALSLFLLQNGVNDRAVSRLYLQSMFEDHQLEEGRTR